MYASDGMQERHNRFVAQQAVEGAKKMPKKEFTWFIEHSELEEKYAGEYIAIVNDVVVAHGKDFKEVLKEAKKHGDEPLFHKVPIADKEQAV